MPGRLDRISDWIAAARTAKYHVGALAHDLDVHPRTLDRYFLVHHHTLPKPLLRELQLLNPPPRSHCPPSGTPWRRLAVAFPKPWLRELQLQDAAKEFKKGHNVNEVADLVGFRSGSSFCHTLKHLTGKPPLRWAA